RLMPGGVLPRPVSGACAHAAPAKAKRAVAAVRRIEVMFTSFTRRRANWMPGLLGAAGKRRAAGAVARPVRPARGEVLVLRLLVVGPAQDAHQALEHRGVALLHRLDRLDRQVVSEDEFGVRLLHLCDPFPRPYGFFFDFSFVTFEPGRKRIVRRTVRVKGGLQAVHGGLFDRKPSKEQSE